MPAALRAVLALLYFDRVRRLDHHVGFRDRHTRQDVAFRFFFPAETRPFDRVAHASRRHFA